MCSKIRLMCFSFTINHSHDYDDDQTSGMTEQPDILEHRLIYINTSQKLKFCSNRITTAKYNLFSFLPKFLFEQFRRYSNVFFLFIALLQQIPNVSPTGRYTTALPLMFILAVSALKEIVEDFKRHRADDQVNKSKTQALRAGQWENVRWANLAVGDIVKVTSGQFFPADLVLLSSSEPQAMCYIETSNLDGETNLKIRQGLPQTADLLTTKDMCQLTGAVECELPNRHLYEFTGNLRLTGRQPLPLGSDQILLRGARLRNTNWVFGIVIYTGHETKLMMNSTTAPMKRSHVDKIINNQIIMMFLLLLVLSLISAIASELWNNAHLQTDWYLGLDELASNFGYNFLTFVILYNNLIPISLQVTLELVRFIQAIFINMDMEMYHDKTDTPAMARTSNLNEELGQVKFVFSDKTGTLTRNVMVFKQCSIAGIIYGNPNAAFDRTELLANILNEHETSTYIREFLLLMSVCHTVVPEMDLLTGQLHYQAASPDEGALVKGAKEIGFVFTTRTPSHVMVSVLGKEEKFEVLNVLEFTSFRKRMSVIIRDSEKKIKLYCKGADTVIFERLGPHQLYREATLEHLKMFASNGFRTLCCAVAEISESFYMEWKETYNKASTAIQFRDRKLDDAAQLIETNLTLLGATAIEDKLQEGVPEAISDLQKADIKVWVLTGDKQETAINIGYSCRLLTHGMPLLILNEDSLDTTREAIRRHTHDFGEILQRDNEAAAIIIDGKTLTFALSSDLRQDFVELALVCKSVVCCRVSPMQKAEVVQMVMSSTQDVTLAIGDGANDVAMIQAAHIGIGISGIEGLQAACASDYAVAQFRFLTRLLFVHGAWSHARLCKLILYSFHKNICLYVIELWFAVISGWSGQTLFERWTIGLYNVIFTAAPPVAMGLFDRTCSAETNMKFPALYRPSQTSSYFNVKVFWVWIFNSILHSIFLFWLGYLSMSQDVAWPNGRDGGYLVLGNMVYTYVVVAVCLKGGLEMNAWNWITHLAIWGSIGSWFLFLLIYTQLWPTFPIAPDMRGIDRMVFGSGVFWMALCIIPFITLLLDVVFKVVRRTVCKSLPEAVQESEMANADPATVIFSATRQRLTETARLLKNVFRRPSTHVSHVPIEMELQHGYAFSQEEHGVVLQSELIRVYDTTKSKPQGV